MEKNKSLIQAVKFTLFSISAGIVQVVSFLLLDLVFPFFKGEYGVNYVISLLLSVLWNFTFNRKFTFKATNDVKKAMLLILLFYAIFTPVTAIAGDYIEKGGVNPYLVLAVTMILNFVLEFLYSKYVVFKETKIATEDLQH